MALAFEKRYTSDLTPQQWGLIKDLMALLQILRRYEFSFCVEWISWLLFGNGRLLFS